MHHFIQPVVSTTSLLHYFGTLLRNYALPMIFSIINKTPQSAITPRILEVSNATYASDSLALCL